MSISGIIAALQQGRMVVETLTPIATIIGGPLAAGVIKIADAIVDVAENTLERVQDGVIVANSDDETEIKAIISKIAAANDELAKAIAAS